MPKKGRSSYFIFSSERREAIKEANPGISVTEISKKLGEEWKNVSEADKAKYQEMAQKEKETQDAAIAEYVKNNPEAAATLKINSSAGAKRKKSSADLSKLSPEDRALQVKIDGLKKLLKDCGITARVFTKDSREETIEKLENMVEVNAVSLAWDAKQRAEFKRVNEANQVRECVNQHDRARKRNGEVEEPHRQVKDRRQRGGVYGAWL